MTVDTNREFSWGRDDVKRVKATSKQAFLTQILLCGTFVYLSYDSAPITLVILCTGAWIGLTAYRLYLSVKTATQSLQRQRNSLLHTNLALGIVIGISVFSFPFLTVAERIVFTIFCSASISRSVSSFADRLMFSYLAAPPLLMMVIHWAIIPIPNQSVWVQVLIAVLTLFFLALLTSESQSFNELFGESNRIKVEQRKTNAQLNKALHQARRANDSKTRFLASASHDLRQPIHTLTLLTAALTMQRLDDQATRISEHLESAVTSLAKQLDSLLDISKLDAGLVQKSIEHFDLVVMLERLYHEYMLPCESKGIQLSFYHQEESALIHNDRTLLERVIRNILSNAVRYTEKGKVTIELSKSNRVWQISISDTGVGIDAQEHNRVFEEFYQIGNPQRDQRRGLGLGLAIVRRLSEILDLDIELKSEPAKGTVFKIIFSELKAAPEVSISPDTKPQENSADVSGLRILCIDDEKDIRDALTILLSEMGCVVEASHSTEGALLLAKESRPDIVLADLRLEQEDTGLHAIDQIRDLYPDMPALLVSGDTNPDVLNQTAAAEIELLHKPVHADMLRSAINRTVRRE